MAQINPSNKKKFGASEVGMLGGAVAGGFFGGPAGAMTGASVGSQAGGMAESQFGKPPAQPIASQQSSALSRRQSQLETDNLATLKQAEQYAYHLPERERQAALPALTKARLLEESNRGLV